MTALGVQLRRTAKSAPRAFTLVEILIVVIILGILASIALHQFSSATRAARESTLRDEIRFMREQIRVFKFQHRDNAPGYAAGAASGAATADEFVRQLTTVTDYTGAATSDSDPNRYGPYLSQMPVNPINGKNTILIVADGDTLPSAASGTYGWVYQPSTLTFRADVTGTDTGNMDYYNY